MTDPNISVMIQQLSPSLLAGLCHLVDLFVILGNSSMSSRGSNACCAFSSMYSRWSWEPIQMPLLEWDLQWTKQWFERTGQLAVTFLKHHPGHQRLKSCDHGFPAPPMLVRHYTHALVDAWKDYNKADDDFPILGRLWNIVRWMGTRCGGSRHTQGQHQFLCEFRNLQGVDQCHIANIFWWICLVSWNKA